MPKLLVLRGIPASGKSTYAKQWVMEDPDNRVRINRDDIREALTGDATNHSMEGKVTEMENLLIEKALRSGKDVVSDNTNLNMAFLPKLIKLAQRNGATVEHKDFPITKEEAYRRNKNRDRQVPEHVIDRMYKMLGPQGQFPLFPGSYPTKPLNLPTQKKLAIGLDMDGTLNDVRNIRHYLKGKRRNFDAFHRMSEFEPAVDDVVAIAKEAHANGYAVIITTARSERYRETTQKWLDDHGIPYENIFMRKDNDMRPDYEVKKDMYDEIAPYYDLVRQIDDNPAAIRAWREKGVPVTVVPFIYDSNMDLVLKVESPFKAGHCVRCGKPFKGEGTLGPTCKLKG